jgi:hypothetical protein
MPGHAIRLASKRGQVQAFSTILRSIWWLVRVGKGDFGVVIEPWVWV